MRWSRPLLVAVLATGTLAGCLTDDGTPLGPEAGGESPFLGYEVPPPDMDLDIVEQAFTLAGEAGVDIYVRVKRPADGGPFPVVAQFTPYTAPGANAELNMLVEPAVGCAVVVGGCDATFDRELVRRGYAFAYADVRGTGDSNGCLDLRGELDIADAWHLTEWLGTQPWSNGRVGFIGASYPGSEAHMAALAGNEHLAAVIPVVASTSFYHYHHNDGVPYNGNHAIGGTNTGYTSEGVTPSLNPATAVMKLLDQPSCPHAENALMHGGLDQTGAYNDWWQERNLRARAASVDVPVLMAQGLADWNVKPDHIATWFNDLAPNGSKTLIAGQWGHQYPRSAGDCGTYEPATGCDPAIPWGDWWAYAAAFFDTHLKGIDTGMFADDVAWVQANDGTWHRSADWPLLPPDREDIVLHFRPGGGLTAEPEGLVGEETAAIWYGCPHDQWNRGTPLAAVEAMTVECDDESPQALVFETEPFGQDTLVSGVPLVHLNLQSDAATTHLTVVVERLGAQGNGEEARENYGYLNPSYREGLDDPQGLPEGTYNVTIDLYPQEDLVKAGQRLRVTIASGDGGRTIEAFEPGSNRVVWGDGMENTLVLPVRPAALQGVRLDG